MIYRVLLLLSFICIQHLSFSQSPEERRNRLVLNRIVHFFNIQQSDSIHALANDKFKKEFPVNQFKLVTNYFFNYGTINQITPISYFNHIAGYNIKIGNKLASIQLSVDDNLRFSYFSILDQPLAEPKKTIVQEVVKKANTFDEFVDSLARSYINQQHTKSLSIATIKNGKINSFFYGNIDQNNPDSKPTANTLYEIGSISKLFTATLLANLSENNLISLDDSITKFLPDSLKENTYLQKITFKQLANHTSGLERLPSNLSSSVNFSENNPYANYASKDLFDYLKNLSPTKTPGEDYIYSNLGYGLLGELISAATKKSYAENIQEYITTPLGMINTTQHINPTTQVLTKVYDKAGQETSVWSFQALAGAGALKSTVSDLLRFVQFQFKMPETTLENAMAQTRLFTYYLPPNTDIGLGWHMNMMNGYTQYWHNGGTGGSSSFIGMIPDQKSAVIVLSNSNLPVDMLSQKILEKLSETK